MGTATKPWIQGNTARKMGWPSRVSCSKVLPMSHLKNKMLNPVFFPIFKQEQVSSLIDKIQKEVVKSTSEWNPYVFPHSTSLVSLSMYWELGWLVRSIRQLSQTCSPLLTSIGVEEIENEPLINGEIWWRTRGQWSSK